MALSVLLVTGIWPPAVGGPASHMPDVARFLQQRGHAIRAITSASTVVDPAPHALRVLRSDRPLPRRLVEGTVTLAGEARHADVVYASGFYTRSTMASARAPVVVKLTTDPAYERARRLGFFEGSMDEFQDGADHPGARALKRVLVWTLSHASHVIVPSRYLASIVRGWDQFATDLSVIPNPRPSLRPSASRDQLRRRFGMNAFTTVFAGRFVPQKDLRAAITAFAGRPAGTLVLVGDGPERGRLEQDVRRLGLQDRVRLVPAVPRQDVVDWFAAADLAFLPSAWENYPHSAVEALTAGTPVLATSVGGVPEIVRHDETGMIVPPHDGDALMGALARCADDERLMNRLRANVSAHAAGVSERDAFSALERILITAANTG